MRLTRGQFKDHDAQLHQAANDWLSIDITIDDERKPSVVNPMAVVLTAEELEELRINAKGHFWALYKSAPSDVDGFPFKLVRA